MSQTTGGMGSSLRRTAWLCAALCTLMAGIRGQDSTAEYRGIEEVLPAAVTPQPVPFSHRQHVETGLKCADCHAGASKGERAGLPSAARCMICHGTIQTGSPAVRKVKEFHDAKKPIPWVRVYKLPSFVFFSHAVHVKAGAACSACHGAVESRDVLQKEVSTSMGACVDCHRKNQASIACHLCHELGQ